METGTMSTKIQINSLAALERLIGNDTELEFEVRQSVASAYSKKHIKGLIDEKLTQHVKPAIQEVLQNEGYLTKGNFSVGLTDNFKKQVKSQVDASISVIVTEHVSDIIKPYKLQLEAALRNAAERIVSELTDASINMRLEAMVDAKIRQRLGV